MADKVMLYLIWNASFQEYQNRNILINQNVRKSDLE